MATMIRVTLPDGGPAVVSTGAVTFGVCLAAELAVIVGTSVPRQRLGSEFRELLELWAEMPKDPDAAVGATNRKTYMAAPGVAAGAIVPGAAATTVTAPNETQWGVIVGDTAALYLDRGNLLKNAIIRAFDQFVPTFGL